jgi:hypothetical protein
VEVRRVEALASPRLYTSHLYSISIVLLVQSIDPIAVIQHNKHTVICLYMAD